MNRSLAGYVTLATSSLSHLGAFAVLMTFGTEAFNVVTTLTLGIVLTAVGVGSGTLGSWMLIPERYLVVIFGIIFFLLALPSLAGASLNLQDYLSASGYNGFGSIIMIMMGNHCLPIGAGLAVVVAFGCLLRSTLQRRKTRGLAH